MNTKSKVKSKKEPQVVQPNLWELNDLVTNAEKMVEDATYKVSKHIADPKKRRHAHNMYDYACSILHYLKELQDINEARFGNGEPLKQNNTQ